MTSIPHKIGFRVVARDNKTRARAGILETPHGAVETPAYVVVGTHGKVRTLESADITASKTRLIIANAYHLWQALGEEGLAAYHGLHAAMGWNGPLMTDSGGFQVFSMGAAREHDTGKIAAKPKTKSTTKSASQHSHILENVGMLHSGGAAEKGIVKITEHGVVFTENGVRHWLDAEKSIRIQRQLGADIIFAFDEPSSPHHNHAYTREAMERTHHWAVRSLKARTSDQMLYGIVQGGPYEDLRKQSAQFIGAMPFDGFAIGGSYGNSFGDTREQTLREVDWAVPYLPEEKPRHLLGIGLIEDLFACIAAGMDTFDCVVPTREARHGSLWVGRGRRIDIKRGVYRDDKSILDEECACVVCADMKTERGALHAMFREKNPEAGRLATLHNISFFNLLMSRIRTAVKDGRFEILCAEYRGNHAV